MSTKIPGKLITYLSILCISLFQISCRDSKNPVRGEVPRSTSSDIAEGINLEKKYCTRCHEFVSPEILPREYWKSVLVRMSPYMGFDPGNDPFYGGTELARNRLDSAMIFPDSQIINMQDWQKLVLYYLENAPEIIEQGIRPVINKNLNRFNVKKVPWTTPLNGLTYVGILGKERVTAGYNYQGDSNKLHVLDLDGKQYQEIKLPSVLTDISSSQNGKKYLTCMGIFEADDTPTGTVVEAGFDSGKNIFKNIQPVLVDRQRPVKIQVQDFDRDQIPELLVSEFGKFLGGLYMYQMKKSGAYNRHILYNGPGALTTILKDLNQDGLPDIVSLISQGNEGIYVYFNEGDLNFTENKILSFPPYYGSIDFEIVDFDQDGLEDIIYISGDSGDFGQPPKPYHGIRFFRNIGNMQYQEKWFIPQQGCYKACIEDFDLDGDPDIASIGFFAFTSGFAQEGFLYMENPGTVTRGTDFQVYSFPEAGIQNFMVMDKGDVDEDGDIDLILGATTTLMSVAEKVQCLFGWQTDGGAIWYLENTTK